jgi:hypothetical protein
MEILKMKYLNPLSNGKLWDWSNDLDDFSQGKKMKKSELVVVVTEMLLPMYTMDSERFKMTKKDLMKMSMSGLDTLHSRLFQLENENYALMDNLEGKGSI